MIHTFNVHLKLTMIDYFLFLQPGFEDENAMDTPIVRYCAVSSIEHSHRAPVTDILWIPDHFELTRMGVPQEAKGGQCIQIMSCATDQ